MSLDQSDLPWAIILTTTGIRIKTLFFKQDELEGQGSRPHGILTVGTFRKFPDSPFGSLHYAPSIASFRMDGVSGLLELEGRYRVIKNAGRQTGLPSP